MILILIVSFSNVGPNILARCLYIGLKAISNSSIKKSHPPIVASNTSGHRRRENLVMRILMIVVMVKGILLWFYISTGDNDDSTSNDDKITSDVNGAHPRIMIVWPAAARKGW